jgi:hypothetical protein
MAILDTDGFDMYNGTAVEIGLAAKWINAGASMVAGRFGGQAVRVNNGGSIYVTRILPTGSSTMTIGIAVNYNALSGNLLSLIALMNANTTFMICLGLTGAGAIIVQRGGGSMYAGTTLGTTVNGVIVIGQWHYIELSVSIHDSTGTIGLKVDGVSRLSLTGQDTRNGTPTTVDTIRLGATDGSSPRCDHDDMYVTDSATPLGERRVETCRVTADTAVKAFVPNAGVTNYTQVDETLVNGDTDYVQGSSVGDRDLYDVTDLSSIPTVIDCVNVVQFDKKTDAATRTMYNSIRSNAGDSDGAAHPLNTTYARNDRIVELDPSGGGAWTAARVNALQIGPKIAS